MKQFRLPDLGEGLTEGEILQWLVQTGDEVRLNQPIVEVETAKAAVEVPSPYAGVVAEIHHGAGEVVDVGSVIISITTGADADPTALLAAAGAAANPVESAAPRASDLPGPEADLLPTPVARAAASDGADLGTTADGRTAVLVGYGPRSVTAARRPRSDRAPLRPARPPGPPAKPPVRKLARERGVDLARLTGSGPSGVITRADVEAAAPAGPPADDAREQRIAVKGVRRATAEAMVRSAFTAPHVTEFLTVDVTASMELLPRLRAMPEFEGLRVSPLLLVAKALLLAVRRHPLVNSTYDGDEIVVKEQVNLGIAAATPRGLLVPNIKDAGALSLGALARALHDLAVTAREGRTAPQDMARGTITITNVGVFGVDTGTPILNPGESAILCLGVVRPTPWVHEGAVAVRQVTQLALSFDHRVVDGQLGSLFLADVARVLADPVTALAWS